MGWPRKGLSLDGGDFPPLAGDLGLSISGMCKTGAECQEICGLADSARYAFP